MPQPAEDAERMILGIEQHLVRPQEMRPDDDGTAVTQLRMRLVRSLPMIAPLTSRTGKLHRARMQGHERATTLHLEFPLPIIAAIPEQMRPHDCRSLRSRGSPGRRGVASACAFACGPSWTPSSARPTADPRTVENASVGLRLVTPCRSPQSPRANSEAIRPLIPK